MAIPERRMENPMRIHCDDRRLFYGDLFPDAGLAGDLNVVVLQPGALIAWHRHQHQTDYLFCVKGSVRVGQTNTLLPDNKFAAGPKSAYAPYFIILHERDPQIIRIPPLTHHGYQNLAAGESILICYTTQHYNPDDEERRIPDENEWKRAPR